MLVERAILETVIYADIFDFPLKAWEIHKWLIKKKCSLSEVERGLIRLVKKRKIGNKEGYYYLKGRSKLIQQRTNRIKPSQGYMRSARIISKLFKIVPWVRFVGISGNLAVENADYSDDIDLFVISKKNRLWLTRLCLLLILALLEKRRKKGDSKSHAAGKFCLNLIVEEDQLEQQRKNLYIAHEVLQLKPLWERDGFYAKFLLANSWVFDVLPNWLTVKLDDSNTSYSFSTGRLVNYLETVVRFLQLRYMGMPKQAERVNQVSVYFHPEDMQPKVLIEFEKRCKKYLGA